MGRLSSSSRRWLREHAADPYVRAAKAQGYRSRAAFKLLEILKKDPILSKGMQVLDLGASPGGWSQVAAQCVGPAGRVWAVDRLSMEPCSGVRVLQADFATPEGVQAIRTCTQRVDVLLSDASPNVSGVRVVDQARGAQLVEEVLVLARDLLRPGGDMIIKVFQGCDFEPLRNTVRNMFERLTLRKPAASRSRSPEMYFVARRLIQQQE